MPVACAMFGITVVMRSVSIGRPDTSVFHGLSFGKMRHPPCIVPGPAVPPPELLALLVDPLDDVLDEAPPELADEPVPPLDDDALFVGSSPPPHATTMLIPKATTAVPLMMRS